MHLRALIFTCFLQLLLVFKMPQLSKTQPERWSWSWCSSSCRRFSYQYLIHGMLETFWKCLKQVWNYASQISENASRGLDFHVFLCFGACQGTPWRPSGGGYSKKHEKITFWDPPFGRHLGQMLTLFCLHFSHVFWDLFSSIFALVLAAIWLNFEGFWPQSRTPIEQIGKSENSDSV